VPKAATKPPAREQGILDVSITYAALFSQMWYNAVASVLRVLRPLAPCQRQRRVTQRRIVKAHVHRSMSEAVARELWPDANCEVLVGASVTMDAVKTVPRHHPTNDTDNIGCIQDWTRAARQEYLEAGLADWCQIQLGNVFHLVQDGFIAFDTREGHNEVEGRVSRFLEQFPFYGIHGERVTTESQVIDFLRDEIRALEDPEQILARAFRVCLSIGRAVTSPREDFSLGVRANHLMKEALRLIQELETECSNWMQREPAKTLEATEEYFRAQIGAMEAASHEVVDGASIRQRISGSHKVQARRYEGEIAGLEMQKTKLLKDSTARNERRLNELLNVAGRVASALQELRVTLAASYQPQYEFAQRNAWWLGIDTDDFLTPRELESFSVRHEDRLCNLAPVLGIIARQTATWVDPMRLKPLESYPVFRTELSTRAKTQETPQWATEQRVPIQVRPTHERDDVEPGEPLGARAATGVRLGNRQLAVLGGLAAAVLVVFSCLTALILLTQA